MLAARVEKAPAKINLTLRVIGRRRDGYHDIESLVAFAGLGDTLSFTPGGNLALVVRGPTAVASGSIVDNLVLQAAHALDERVAGLKLGRFVLAKRLPVAAGLGGGSSDAAAALRLLAQANQLGRNDPRLMQAARATGADVPVCLDPRPRLMRGIGDILSDPLELPPMSVILVNPGVKLATKNVFDLLRNSGTPKAEFGWEGERARFFAALAGSGNDLEKPAIRLQPVIGDVLASLQALPGCRIARMSGSGATCFGLFERAGAAGAAARNLRAEHPSWWIRATKVAA
jgi:4-diphosphocytidyl-2-C-methyl-D-erythritol kinase